MTPDEIAEILRLHGMWLLLKNGGKRADLSGADLSDANLRGADLRDADLSDADLGWVKAGPGLIAQWGSRYWAISVRASSGVRWLKYGCVAMNLDEWDTQHDELAARHEPTRSALFAAETRALVALCRTLDLEANQ